MNKKESEMHIAIFNEKVIRRKLVDDKWFFSVVDIVGILSESENPRNYWKVLKHRLIKEGSEVVTFCNQLKLKSLDGKEYETDCADTKGILRIIQSIPSKNAEPLKRWLAKVGYERVQEIENPELAQERMKNLYELKGYPKDWIDRRLRGIAIRQNLTDEHCSVNPKLANEGVWKDRDVDENIEYAILTNEISKATFGKTIEEYKKFKNLNRENLRDHMDELELIFSMLGEKVTTKITVSKNVKGFIECAIAAKQGGDVAGNARKEAEQKIGHSVILKDNFLLSSKKKKKKKIENEVLKKNE